MATVHDADLNAVGSTLSTPQVTNFIRDLVRDAFQELIETDFAAHIGAAPHERTDSRTNLRNGHRPRLLSTQAGDIDLEVQPTSHPTEWPCGDVTSGRESPSACTPSLHHPLEHPCPPRQRAAVDLVDDPQQPADRPAVVPLLARPVVVRDLGHPVVARHP